MWWSSATVLFIRIYSYLFVFSIRVGTVSTIALGCLGSKHHRLFERVPHPETPQTVWAANTLGCLNLCRIPKHPRLFGLGRKHPRLFELVPPPARTSLPNAGLVL